MQQRGVRVLAARQGRRVVLRAGDVGDPDAGACPARSIRSRRRRGARQVAKHLSNSKHVVIPGTGHTAGGTGCGQRIMRSFIDKGIDRRTSTPACIDKRQAAAVLPHAGRTRIPTPPRPADRLKPNDSHREPAQALRRGARRRRRDVHRRRRPGHRPARPQRRRQDHDAADALHVDAPGRGPDPRRR